jgi:hypothetical protein
MDKPLYPSRVAQRVCLKCNKKFLSQSAGNRICKECAKINASFGPIPEAVLDKQRGIKRRNGEPIEPHPDDKQLSDS